MFNQVDWGAVGFFWGVFITLIQLGTAVVVLLLKRQAQNFQSQTATSGAIEDVSRNLGSAIAATASQLRNELGQSIGALKAEIEKLEQGDHGMERRVVVLEQALAHAPKARDLADLRQEISNLGLQVARFEGSQHEQNRVLRLIHEFMMEKSR
jgi:hypothetical protein